MTNSEVIKAHIDSGLHICEQKSARDTDTTKLAKFNQCLANRMKQSTKDGKPEFDCVLSISGAGLSGKPTIEHLEQVEGVKYDKKTGYADIKTTNGLKQGVKGTNVPATPGTNTWSSAPDTIPRIVPLGAAGRSEAKLLNKIFVSSMSYMCCRARRPGETNAMARASLKICD